MVGPKVNISALNDVDSIYGTRPQQDFAQEMAKKLLGEQAPTEARHWTQGMAYILRQLAGAQYRDIAGSQLSKNTPQVGATALPAANTYGRPVSQPQSPEIPLPNVPGIQVTGTRPPAKLGGPESTPAMEAAKSFEGFRSNAYPDAKGTTAIGYGTPGKPGETIDKAEGTRRFNENWAKAEKLVNDFHPNMDEGLKEALTDLTFNSGTKWMSAGLGAAVKAGNMAEVKRLFNEYNKADMGDGKGLQPKSNLISRRDQFTDLIPDGRMNAGLGDVDKSQLPMATQSEKQNYPIEGLPGGYRGPMPDVRPVMSAQNINAMLRGASDPAQQSKILGEYYKSLEPYTQEVPGGYFQITPSPDPSIPPRVKFFQSPKETTLSVGDIGNIPVTRTMDEKGNPGAITPNFNGAYGLQGLSPIVQDAAKLKAEGDATKGIIGSQAEGIKADLSPEKIARTGRSIQDIRTLIAANEEGGYWRPTGPTAEYANKVRGIIANIIPGAEKAITGTVPNEIINKVNGVLASNMTQEFTNRGTNFDLQTFMNANPGMMTSKHGTKVLSDLMLQRFKQEQEIEKIASKLTGLDAQSYSAMKLEYYKTHPLVMIDPKDPKQKIYMGGYSGPDDPLFQDQVPVGAKFLTQDGRVMVRHK